MAQVGVHGLGSSDAQQRSAERGPPGEAVADEEQEEVVRRKRLEDGCVTRPQPFSAIPLPLGKPCPGVQNLKTI